MSRAPGRAKEAKPAACKNGHSHSHSSHNLMLAAGPFSAEPFNGTRATDCVSHRKMLLSLRSRSIVSTSTQRQMEKSASWYCSTTPRMWEITTHQQKTCVGLPRTLSAMFTSHMLPRVPKESPKSTILPCAELLRQPFWCVWRKRGERGCFFCNVFCLWDAPYWVRHP